MAKLKFTYTSWSDVSYRVTEEFDIDDDDLEEIAEEGGFDEWLQARDWPHEYAKESILNDVNYHIELVTE